MKARSSNPLVNLLTKRSGIWQQILKYLGYAHHAVFLLRRLYLQTRQALLGLQAKHKHFFDSLQQTVFIVGADLSMSEQRFTRYNIRYCHTVLEYSRVLKRIEGKSSLSAVWFLMGKSDYEILDWQAKLKDCVEFAENTFQASLSPSDSELKIRFLSIRRFSDFIATSNMKNGRSTSYLTVTIVIIRATMGNRTL